MDKTTIQFIKRDLDAIWKDYAEKIRTCRDYKDMYVIFKDLTFAQLQYFEELENSIE